ncbi:hypothetical protein CALCODRAFT_504302 [Calocera cornea HHB12733]|uniref:Glycoside hydrolase family 16 protein n=1 Tax=Calocera cornea HHB12733 TaxID=1353952 RepID=A0A165CHF5_9BASI|nr:hypothetical protein CALCODRAFT_504302 [Calocera cornea HHB12733]
MDLKRLILFSCLLVSHAYYITPFTPDSWQRILIDSGLLSYGGYWTDADPQTGYCPEACVGDDLEAYNAHDPTTSARLTRHAA